jgi:hypothetical protein
MLLRHMFHVFEAGRVDVGDGLVEGHWQDMTFEEQTHP